MEMNGNEREMKEQLNEGMELEERRKAYTDARNIARKCVENGERAH